MTDAACPHGRRPDEPCPQCSQAFKDAVVAGKADMMMVKSVDFANDVQKVYERLVSALEDTPRQDEPGYGTVQCMAIAVLMLVTLEVLAEKMPSLRSERMLQDLVFTSLKLKMMPPMEPK